MKITSKNFQVSAEKKVHLKKWPTLIKPICPSKPLYQELLQQHVKDLSTMQNVLYASDQYALLLLFQGMDAAGKDSAIKHVMSGVNPQGCEVYSFKEPSAEELTHDFLWRTACRLPERGRIGIFNRTYYEEVLIVRVHPNLLQARQITRESLSKKFWQNRYDSIINFEKHLYRNKTRVIKFFLHLSKEEQKNRFLSRIEMQEKKWKFHLNDVKEREYWSEYMHAYEACLSATSTQENPWYIVPADDKENAQLIISQIILEEFAKLKLSYPKPDKKHQKELEMSRKLLEKSTS